MAKDRLRAVQFENGGLSNRQRKKELKKKRYNGLKLLKEKQKKAIYYVRADKMAGKVDEDGAMSGPSRIEPDDFIKTFEEKRKKEIARRMRVEIMQQNERKRHQNQRKFLDPFNPESKKKHHPEPLFQQVDDETFVEVFDKTGKLISVNGFVLDYEGKPVRNESVDLNGELISINGVPVEDIPDYTGKVIREEHGHLISMFGPPARELIRDGN